MQSLFEWCRENKKEYLLEEWDNDKNIGVTPYNVSKGQSKKVWWICPRGHSYQASLNNRSQGKGCPYCRNLKVLSGYNDFETWCKNNNQLVLLSEWDKDKNDIQPEQIPPSYNKNVYWKCSICGKDFESKVSNRIQHNHKAYVEKHGERIIEGCPSCSKKIAHDKVSFSLIKKNGSLFDYDKKIANEWDYEKNGKLTPDSVTFGSIKKVWWKCPKEHSYQATVASRTSGVGCPFCSGKKVLKGFNDLATTNPALLEEWNYEKNTFKPDEITSGADKKAWWKCKVCGYEWEALVYSRSSTGCPRCSKELRTSFPEQAIFFYISKLFPDAINGDRHLKKELDIYIPSKNVAIEYDGYKWHFNIQKDILKDELCEKNGIKLYRIREYGCAPLPFNNNVTIFMIKDGDRQALSKIIKKICDTISENKIQVDVIKDEESIYSQYASNVKANSFAIRHPELLKYWDYEKNKSIKPEYITDRTQRQVWWICEKGHSYKQRVNSKTIGIGCPICSNKRIKVGFNDLATVRPDLTLEWNFKKNEDLLPTQVTEHAGKNVWWIGTCGHEWKATVDSRSSGSGCPYCSTPAKKVLKGFNDLQSKYPQIADEWDKQKNILSPSDVLPGSSKLVWWICPLGHSYRKEIVKRVDGQGCPICSRHQIVENINDLATTHPDLIKEWNNEKNTISITEVSYGSMRKVWWKCALGHEWQAPVNSRVRGSGCPYCANKRILEGYNDLSTTDSYLLKKWDYSKNTNVNPSQLTKGSQKKVWWICSKGHSFSSTVNDMVVTHGNKCPICNNKRIIRSVNSLETTNPELLKEWDYEKNTIKPSQISYGSTKKIFWKCEKGHSYITTVNAKTSKKSGCPYCSNQKILKGYNDLAFLYPDIAKEWNYKKNKMGPDEILPHSHIRVWWICENGHEWESTVSNRLRCGCPFCAKKRIQKGYNDLETTNPELLKEWDYTKNSLLPSEVSFGMNKKIWWKCPKGHSYQAVLYSRKAGNGCPLCGRKQAAKKKEKPVILIDKNIKFQSLNSAADYCGITPGAISACCKGKTKTAGGYHWRFTQKIY